VQIIVNVLVITVIIIIIIIPILLHTICVVCCNVPSDRGLHSVSERVVLSVAPMLQCSQHASHNAITHIGCPACIEQMILSPAGKLPTPVAAHLTAKGGWVEFHPSSNPSFAAASTSDAGAPTLPTLRPLAWFRFSTQEEQTVLESYLEVEIEMHGRQTEFVHDHELSWWRVDTDIHQVADHWQGVLCLVYT